MFHRVRLPRCVCVCGRARARACVRVYVSVCGCGCVGEGGLYSCCIRAFSELGISGNMLPWPGETMKACPGCSTLGVGKTVVMSSSWLDLSVRCARTCQDTATQSPD